jgi:hypothetical protein
MGEAIPWGLVAGSSLLVGAVIALRRRATQRTAGLIVAFGAGLLISAVAYELVAEAVESGTALALIALGLGAGAPRVIALGRGHDPTCSDEPCRCQGPDPLAIRAQRGTAWRRVTSGARSVTVGWSGEVT